VQSDGFDPYTPEEIGRWFDLVRATVYATNGAVPYYMPTFEQREMARTNADAFAARGIPRRFRGTAGLREHMVPAGWALETAQYFRGSPMLVRRVCRRQAGE